MNLSELYEKAKEFSDKIRTEKPAFIDRYAAFIAGDNDEVYLGVSGLALRDGKLVNQPADVSAALNMANAGCRVATGLVIISPKSGSVLKPSEEGLALLFKTNAKNDGCLVYLSETDNPTVLKLRFGDNAASMMDGFDFGGDDSAPAPSASAAAPAAKPAGEKEASNVIRGVGIDENNPFYEAPSDVKPPEEIIAADNAAAAAAAAQKKPAPEEPELTPEELLEQAKRRKKVARSNFLFRRKK
ncbi:MAG: hypothetical protein IKP47_11025 [Ruminococcus sp.]|nr:hypothetical protein [Ruminococcus sp.]